MAENKAVAILMAGGSGTRFFPLSRKDLPKQFLPLTSSQSLIQESVERLTPLFPEIYICAGKNQSALLQQHVPQVPTILEPIGKNTAPCLMLSVAELYRKGHDDDTVMCVFSSDHYIKNVPLFQKRVAQGISFARHSQGLITLGIVPTAPLTGYGYIETKKGEGEILQATRFIEKPNLAKANEFLDSGNFYWNAGIFIWTLGAIRSAFEKYMPTDWKIISAAELPADWEKAYQQVTATPIDKGIMEKASNVHVIPADIGWSDIGSWNSLYHLRKKDSHGHVSSAPNLKSEQSQDCFVHSEKKVILVGVKNLVIVDTGDTLLILDRYNDQLVRNVADT